MSFATTGLAAIDVEDGAKEWRHSTSPVSGDRPSVPREVTNTTCGIPPKVARTGEEWVMTSFWPLHRVLPSLAWTAIRHWLATLQFRNTRSPTTSGEAAFCQRITDVPGNSARKSRLQTTAPVSALKQYSLRYDVST